MEFAVAALISLYRRELAALIVVIGLVAMVIAHPWIATTSVVALGTAEWLASKPKPTVETPLRRDAEWVARAAKFN